MARHTTITIETRSLLIVEARRSCRAWCPRCSAEADMVAVESTDGISGLDAVAVTAWLASGEVHQCAGPEGSTLICLTSLLARICVGKTS